MKQDYTTRHDGMLMSPSTRLNPECSKKHSNPTRPLYNKLSTVFIAMLTLALTHPIAANSSCPPNTLYGVPVSNYSSINSLNATTLAINSTHSLSVSTFAIAFNSVDGRVYYVSNATGNGSTAYVLYAFNPATGTSTNTGYTLPALPSGGTYYISAGSDDNGGLYFTSSKGQHAYKITPTSSGTVTTLWNLTTPVIQDPERPYGVNFTTDYKDMTLDASGNLLFVDDLLHHMWVVNPTTRQATYRGLINVTGSVGDLYFANGGTLYVSTSANGVYSVNPNTLASTLVSSTYNSAEIASPPCEASNLPSLSVTPCPANTIFASSNDGSAIQKVNATTFATLNSYTLPISSYSVAWAANGKVYAAAVGYNTPNPPVYALNPATGAVYNTNCTLPTLGTNEYGIVNLV